MTKSGFRYAAAGVRRATTLLAIASLPSLAACARSHLARGDIDSAPVTPNRLTRAERDAGWTLLFDGRTLAGWRGLGYPGVPASHWVVTDGAIKKISGGKVPVQADGQPLEGGDLMTEATYGDFELAWEWRVTPGANSGVKYNVSEELPTSTPRNDGVGTSCSRITATRCTSGTFASGIWTARSGKKATDPPSDRIAGLLTTDA